MSTASSSSEANIQSNGISKAMESRTSTGAAEDFVPHLNPHGLVIRMTEKKGRGVFATRSIPSGTLVDASPVLLFDKEEYESHGRHTVVDDYSFVWGDGRMALALGLGSIMNHSEEKPNVAYSRDKTNFCMRFTTMKPIEPEDELCIYYGPKLWFDSAEKTAAKDEDLSAALSQTDVDISTDPTASVEDEKSADEDSWPNVQASSETTPSESEQAASALLRPPHRSRRSRRKRPTDNRKLSTLSPKEAAELSNATRRTSLPVIPPDDLPFDRLKFPDEEGVETDDGPFPTAQIWAVNISDAKKIGPMLEHIRLNADLYEVESLKQLKRIRRTQDPVTKETITEFAVAPYHPATPSPPPFPDSLSIYHSDPFVTTVPATVATSHVQLVRKSALWPVGFYPILNVAKKEKEWTQREVDWVQNGLKTVITEATRVKGEAGELPIAAYVTSYYDSSTVPSPTPESSEAEPPEDHPTPPLRGSWIDHDTRNSAHHPLRHACMNIIRSVAGTQSAIVSSSTSPEPQSAPTPTLTPAYLLTSYALFVTHEPCIMCSMALLHSRVKNIFYIYPMPRTGGCGGLVKESVPGLKGVNHRFGIWRWKESRLEELVEGDELDVDEAVDV